MTLDAERLREPVTALLREVARDVVLPRFQRLAAGELAEKSPGDYVTIADAESEARLAEGLGALLPGAAFVGEEAAAADPRVLERVGSGLAWIVDPLDGTNNFAEGSGPFALMVGLARDGEREAGWILDPRADRVCWAARGRGAFVDGRPVRARRSEAARPRVAIAMYYVTPERQAELRARAAGRLEIVGIPRCAGEQYPRLVLGVDDACLFEKTHPWDHAAGALLLEEAGGRIARADGDAYRLADPRHGAVAATSPATWELVREALFG